jgi:hypothetical protein
MSFNARKRNEGGTMNPTLRPTSGVIGHDRLPPQRWFGVALAAFLFLPLTNVQAATGALPKAEKSAFSPTVTVRVTSDNKPVAGAQVVALYVDKLPSALTDGDGLARVPLPADGKINALVALHAKLGIGGHLFGFHVLQFAPVLRLSSPKSGPPFLGVAIGGPALAGPTLRPSCVSESRSVI